MKLTSSAFEHNQTIPSKYTCDGDNISPPLSITDIPEETKTLALICDDPDAPNGDFVHWVVFNIPTSTTQINEGEAPEGIQGTTNFNKTKYGGPCPPSGTHRYFFKVYALDTDIDLDSEANKAKLLEAMENHVLESAEIIGLYKKIK